MKKETIVAAVTAVKAVAEKALENETVRGTLLGTYTNGKPRSVIDAVNGEIYSPEDQLLITKRIEKHKKKKKKKEERGEKYAKIDLSKLSFNFDTDSDSK